MTAEFTLCKMLCVLACKVKAQVMTAGFKPADNAVVTRDLNVIALGYNNWS